MRHVALLRDRDDLPRLLAAKRLTGIGVEVGVQYGEYSEAILEGSRLSRLILVDPWTESVEYWDAANVPQEQQDAIFASARERLTRFGDRAEFWRTTSVEAAVKVPDSSFDFIYIDARHDFDSVAEDVAVWYPKLRSGGVIAGHDYYDGTNEAGVFGVRSAVDGFFAARSVKIYSTFSPHSPTWLVAPPNPVIDAARKVLLGAERVRRKIHHVRVTGHWR